MARDRRDAWCRSRRGDRQPCPVPRVAPSEFCSQQYRPIEISKAPGRNQGLFISALSEPEDRFA